ncbi:type II secretion system protein [Citricoccus nitrophenolicus]|uniref:type II secretion system protein n=1 Tax=Citricoccus nitrophenolicus TaxID=863575 RepID=UPI0031EEF4B8
MNNPLSRLKARRTEHGFSIPEMMIGVLLTAIIGAVVVGAIANYSMVAQRMAEDEQGKNQGQVMNDARSIYEAAEAFHFKYPDPEVNRENLEASEFAPEIQTDDLVWGVGQTTRNTDNKLNTVCVAAWSPTEDVERYTEEWPAEVDAVQQAAGKPLPGCWSYDAEGVWGPVSR